MMTKIWCTVLMLLVVLTLGEGNAHERSAHTSGPGANTVESLDIYVQGGTIHLLLTEHAANTERLRIQYLRSEDEGAHWSAPVQVDNGMPPPNAPYRGNDVQIAAVGDRLLAVWTTMGNGFMGRGPLVTAVSTDGGRTWQPGVNPADDGTTTGHSFIDVVADAKGAFHLVWLDSRRGAQGLQYARSVGGLVWSANATLDSMTCECCWNTVVTGSQGILYVLYRDKDPRDMALAESSDGGITWIQRGRVGHFDWRIDGCPHVGGGLAITPGPDHPTLHTVVWTGKEHTTGVYYLNSTDDGRTWSAPYQLGESRAKHADIAVAVDGTVAAVWDTFIQNEFAIVGATSTDGGRTWSEPRRLSRPGLSATHPRVVAVPAGLRVFWTEEGHDHVTVWTMAILSEISGS